MQTQRRPGVPRWRRSTLVVGIIFIVPKRNGGDENVPSHFANGKAPSWIVQYGNKEIGLLSSLARPFRRLSTAASGRDYHSVTSSRPTLLGIEGLQKVVVYCKVKQPSYIRRHVDHRSSKDFTPSEMWTVSRGYETHVVRYPSGYLCENQVWHLLLRRAPRTAPSGGSLIPQFPRMMRLVRANAEARVYWFPAADVAKFWFTSDRTLEVLIVSALVGSALTSRPEDFSFGLDGVFWRPGYRRGIISHILHCPGDVGDFRVPIPTIQDLEQLGLDSAVHPAILQIYGILLSITEDSMSLVARAMADCYCRGIFEGIKALDNNRSGTFVSIGKANVSSSARLCLAFRLFLGFTRPVLLEYIVNLNTHYCPKYFLSLSLFLKPQQFFIKDYCVRYNQSHLKHWHWFIEVLFCYHPTQDDAPDAEYLELFTLDESWIPWNQLPLGSIFDDSEFRALQSICNTPEKPEHFLDC
ncbi:hypothetical protein VTP01DRAFT_5983 [Rhizomucor pusillus]|uniref:uncharacterized protein n=1 Tax=Rhizomucor pusillus TaxID=4840 RepID=UPI003744A65F